MSNRNMFGITDDLSTITDLKQNIYDVLSKWSNLSTFTLSSYIKPALITAPVFIQENVYKEPVTEHVIKALFNMYSSFILVAIQLDGIVSSSLTVRDIVEKVSTESYLDNSNIDILLKNIKLDNKKIIASLENSSDDLDDSNNNSNNSSNKNNTKSKDKNIDKTHDKLSKLDSVVYKYNAGRIISVDLNVPKMSQPITIYLYCQFLNRVVNTQFMNKLIELTNIDTKYRWTMYKAGEIKFWKDFILGLDLFKKRLQLIKYDDKGIFRDILKRTNKSFFKKIIGIFLPTSHSKVNIHNNIYIVNENDLKAVSSKVGININRMNNVERMLFNLRGIFLVSIDTLHQMVTFYIYGLSNPLQFTYKELMRSSVGKGNQMDIVSLLEMFKQGQI